MATSKSQNILRTLKDPYKFIPKLMIKDKKGREEMGANLKTVTDEYFDINKVVKFRYDLYQQLLGVNKV